MKLIRLALMLPVFVCLLSTFTTAQTEFFSSEFDEDWIDLEIVVDNPFVNGDGPLVSGASISTPASNGNPGANRLSAYNLTAGDWVLSGGKCEDWIYEPSQQGPIESFNFDLDAAGTNLDGQGNQPVMVVLEQDDTLYFSVDDFAINFNNSGFVPFSANELVSDSFDTNPAAIAGSTPRDGQTPDFSSSGNEIRFGYVILSGILTGGPTLTTTARIDNLSITVSSQIVGDINCDGEVNLLDVAPFVELITTGGFLDKADVNEDGVVDLLDVSPFVALLSDG